MNSATLTRPRTRGAEPGQHTCLQAVASFEHLMCREQGTLPCEGQAPRPTDAARVVKKGQIPGKAVIRRECICL